MYPKPTQNLIDFFTKFPGIGPRQAARFVFFILKQNAGFLDKFIESLKNVKDGVGWCEQCFRSMEKTDNSFSRCSFCINTKRQTHIIAVVEKESDMLNLEKTRSFQGLYHILGGTIDPLDSNSPGRLHLKDLYNRVKNVLDKNSLCEVVLATNPTTDGDMTSLYIERILSPLKDNFSGFVISRLGRGLSLGSELEHVDETTLKSAFLGRKFT